MHIYLFVRTMLLDIGIQLEISYNDVAFASCVQMSVCHLILSHDTIDILLAIVGGKSGSIDASITLYVSFDSPYKTSAGFSISLRNTYDAQQYLKYLAK